MKQISGHERADRMMPLLLVALFIAGLFLMLYPTVSDLINTRNQSQVISVHESAVEAIPKDERTQMLALAQEYNKALAEKGDSAWFLSEYEKGVYQHVLNPFGNGIMGYIEIPKIEVRLPIYHGLEDVVLQVAVGHIDGSSLPVGGEGSHCVLSGHRGLPSARLFSDLDQLRDGDRFYLFVLGQTFTYEVDKISVVEPEDISQLQIESGKDYCSLVTCTPYGVNTHRLLVRGVRVETSAETEDKLEKNTEYDKERQNESLRLTIKRILPFAEALVMIVLLGNLLLRNRSGGKKSRKNVQCREDDRGAEN